MRGIAIRRGAIVAAAALALAGLQACIGGTARLAGEAAEDAVVETGIVDSPSEEDVATVEEPFETETGDAAEEAEEVMDAQDARDIPCPPGDLCGPGERWDSYHNRCSENCLDPCANPCPPERPICGCMGSMGMCNDPESCYCLDDWDCDIIDPDGDRCNGTWYCSGERCRWRPPVTCEEGEACDPATGDCLPI
jgi:hypothetical protein